MMGASVRIEDEAFSDRRYERLAAEAGLTDADHARGKMAVLWRQCTIEHTHILEVSDVVPVLGPRGVEALELSRLGERVDSTRVRIRGTRGRIEWLAKLRKNGAKGGRPKKTKWKPSGSAEPNPPAPAPAPAQLHERDSALGLAKIEQVGYPRCGSLTGPGAAAIRKLGNVTEAEVTDALRDPKVRHWVYMARVIESMRIEAARPPSEPGEQRARAGPRPSSSPFARATNAAMEAARERDRLREAPDPPTGLLPAKGQR